MAYAGVERVDFLDLHDEPIHLRCRVIAPRALPKTKYTGIDNYKHLSGANFRICRVALQCVMAITPPENRGDFQERMMDVGSDSGCRATVT